MRSAVLLILVLLQPNLPPITQAAVRPIDVVHYSVRIEPAWSPDGTELFFRDRFGSKMMVVDVVLEPESLPGQARLLFEGSFVQTPWYGRNYDVAPDGQSFIMIQQDLGGLEEAELRIVLNWGEELKDIVSLER